MILPIDFGKIQRSSMKIKVTPDAEFAKEIKAKIKANNNYCPCRLTKSPDTKCMCKEFREQTTEGYCHCGLYYKTLD